MKKAISISIGSSKRNKKVELEILGEKIQIERTGTDGDMKQAEQMFTAADGVYDAIGCGGFDIGFLVETTFYPMYSCYKMVRNVKKSPLVDGNGLKLTLEGKIKKFLDDDFGGYVKQKRAFVMAGIDRWAMSKAIANANYDVVYGDLMFGLGLPFTIRSLKNVRKLAALLLPIVGHFPFDWLYPTGKEQEKRTPKWTKYFDWATVLAGDCNYITRYMPERLDGKIIITNTTTPADREQFRKAGVKYVVTTTPVFEGRSFGTNMMEATLNAVVGRKTPVDYFHPVPYLKEMEALVDKVKFEPQLQELN